jgi:hypothetical protein
LLSHISPLQPQFIRLDSPTHIIFKVRNLPYPLDTYSVGVDEEAEEIVIRTSNRKYFKRTQLSDCKELRIPLDHTCLAFTHANDTLTVRYAKPASLVQLEENRLQEAMELAKPR